MGIKITPSTSHDIIDAVVDMIAYRLSIASTEAERLLRRMGPEVMVSREDDNVVFDYELKQIAVFRNIDSNRFGCVVHERRRLNVDLFDVKSDI